MRRGPRNLWVAADGVGLSQFCGVVLLEQFFQRIQLQSALWRQIRFAQRNIHYSISESLSDSTQSISKPEYLCWSIYAHTL